MDSHIPSQMEVIGGDSDELDSLLRHREDKTISVVKILEFAVGRKGKKMQTIHPYSDLVLVSHEDFWDTKNYMFEVYCRGRIWGNLTEESKYEHFQNMKLADYFTIKVASNTEQGIRRIRGELYPILYSNLSEKFSLESMPSYYTAHIGFCCLNYNQELAFGIPGPFAPLDAKFNNSATRWRELIEVGKQFDDISAVYRKIRRNHMRLTHLYYLLNEDINKSIYNIYFATRQWAIEDVFACMDGCIEDIYSILCESAKSNIRNINFWNIKNAITNLRISSITKQSLDAKLLVNKVLDKELTTLLTKFRKSQCYKHLAKHRNQRIAHIGRNFPKNEKRSRDFQPEIIDLSFNVVDGYYWTNIGEILYEDITYCEEAIECIEQSLTMIAQGLEIFYPHPARHYRDTIGYARQSAVWQLYDMLPKEKFDVAWLEAAEIPPS